MLKLEASVTSWLTELKWKKTNSNSKITIVYVCLYVIVKWHNSCGWMQFEIPTNIVVLKSWSFSHTVLEQSGGIHDIVALYQKSHVRPLSYLTCLIPLPYTKQSTSIGLLHFSTNIMPILSDQNRAIAIGLLQAGTPVKQNHGCLPESVVDTHITEHYWTQSTEVMKSLLWFLKLDIFSLICAQSAMK